MKSSYHISLGSKFLGRARIIFGTLTGIFFLFFITGIYTGIQSGYFDQNLMQPFRQLAKDFNAAMEITEPQTTSLDLNFEPVYIPSPTPEQTQVKTKTQYSDTNTTTTTTTYTQTTTSDEAYNKAKAEQDAWWAKVQAQNQALSEQSKKELEDFKAQSAKKMEEFKSQSQTDFAKFSEEGQAQMEEFKKKYGIQ